MRELLITAAAILTMILIAKDPVLNIGTKPIPELFIEKMMYEAGK